ncbi:hypothetical protein [Volucribacter psittacicida]|uniref:hypothetical protein n=1 Tax=Volucribacter psittacicida TaxID=203482 RepID=UPI00104EF59A|nr:hypothetical protein [Volucribacter psittacicida]
MLFNNLSQKHIACLMVRVSQSVVTDLPLNRMEESPNQAIFHLAEMLATAMNREAQTQGKKYDSQLSLFQSTLHREPM